MAKLTLAQQNTYLRCRMIMSYPECMTYVLSVDAALTAEEFDLPYHEQTELLYSRLQDVPVPLREISFDYTILLRRWVEADRPTRAAFVLSWSRQQLKEHQYKEIAKIFDYEMTHPVTLDLLDYLIQSNGDLGDKMVELGDPQAIDDFVNLSLGLPPERERRGLGTHPSTCL